MPDQLIKNELIVINDPSGSQIRVIEQAHSAWRKELVLMSRGPDGGNWSSYVYIIGPIETREISDWLKRTVDKAFNEVRRNPNHGNHIHERPSNYSSAKKRLRELYIHVPKDIYRDETERRIQFCLYGRLTNAETIYDLCDFLDNYSPEF